MNFNLLNSLSLSIIIQDSDEHIKEILSFSRSMAELMFLKISNCIVYVSAYFSLLRVY
jgi:hypothetical protein